MIFKGKINGIDGIIKHYHPYHTPSGGRGDLRHIFPPELLGEIYIWYTNYIGEKYKLLINILGSRCCWFLRANCTRRGCWARRSTWSSARPSPTASAKETSGMFLAVVSILQGCIPSIVKAFQSPI